MKKIFNEFNNVFFDESSSYKFEQLSETIFIKEIITSLSKIMKDGFNEYLFIILSSHNPDIIPLSINYQSKQKKILIFISDESGTVPEYLSPHYYAIFKAYMQPDKNLVDNVFNFSLGCVRSVPQLPIIPIANRQYSVFFIGNLNRPRMKFYFSLIHPYIPFKLLNLSIFKYSRIRKLLLRLKSNFDSRFPHSYIRFTNGFQQGITPAKYGQFIANSKIVLCPKGFKSTECFRHYEAMRAGCIIVSEKLPNTQFYKDSPIVQIDNWGEGLKKVKDLLGNHSELEKLHYLTLNWWKEKCSEVATAQYVYSCINQLNDK